MALPAQLHASAALAPCCLKNCDADAAGQKLENLSQGGLGKRQVEQEGRMRCSRRVCRSKRMVAISKRIVARSSTSVQVQKKCNEVQKKCCPFKCPTPAIVFGNATSPSRFSSLLTPCTIPCACHVKRHLNVQKCSEPVSFLHF